MKNNNNGKKIHRETKRTRKRIKENEKKTKKKNKNNIKGKTIVKVKFCSSRNNSYCCVFVRFSSYCAILRNRVYFSLSVRLRFPFFSPPRLHRWKSILSWAIQEGLHPLDVSVHKRVVYTYWSSNSVAFRSFFFLLLLLSVLLYFVLFVRDRFF